jgi:hypothetical protein
MYTAKKACKALHFIMRVLEKGKSNTTRLADMSLVRSILQSGASCWETYREGQMNAVDPVNKKAAKFAKSYQRFSTPNSSPAVLALNPISLARVCMLCVCVCVFVCMYVCERGCGCGCVVGVCVGMCICVCCMRVCVCVCERERERVCVCVCG